MKPLAKPPLNSANMKVVALLNSALAAAIALKINTKQAHWNVKGENFIMLHELFDKVSAELETFYDTIAERAVQIGGFAEGGIPAIAKHKGIESTSDAAKLVRAIGSGLKALADQARDGIDEADKLGDKVTADTLTQVTSGLDKLAWFVTSHQK